MHQAASIELARLRRRVVTARFLEGTVLANCVLAGAAGTVVLVARLLGSYLPPDWSWLWIGLGAAAAFGAFVAWRGCWSLEALAAHIDRRHGLGGLLIAGLERDAVAWNPELAQRIEQSRAELPSFHPQRWLVRAVVVAGFAGGIAILPPPETPRQQSMVRGELERIAEEVELALEAGSIDEESAEEMRDRVGEMQRMLEEGDTVEWSDADNLAERLEHEESLRLDRLEAARAELGEFAKAEDAAGSTAQQDLSSAMEHAAELGLLEDLPKELQDMLGNMQSAQDGESSDSELQAAAQKLDVAALGLNAQQLQALAKGLQNAVDGELGKLAQLGKLPENELEDLDAILQAAQDGQGFGLGGQDSERSMPGRGGVNRGRGDAALEYSNRSDTDTSKLDVKRLPPGVAAPREWSIVGMRRTAPESDAQRDNTGGSAGTAGTGKVTWRRRLAPRHRDAIRRFFSSRGKEPPK